MFTQRLNHLSLLLLGLFSCGAATAQDSLLLRDIATVRMQDAWLRHDNAAALTRLAVPDIATAQVATTSERGGLVDYSGARRQLTADVAVEAFSRLSRRTVVYGAISYQNFSGKDMTGSAFTPHLSPLTSHLSPLSSPRRPFDLVEDSLTNIGDKHLDTYQLLGGVGVDLWHGIAVGARVDYTSANYAKYKDLRHKNKLMDLSLTAGIYAPLTAWLSVGADYQYHRQTESVTFSTYGKSEKVYKTLIDYGTFIGRVEQFGSEGFTEKNREMPLFEDGHGGGLQAELRPLPQLSLLATARMNHGAGYYGRRSPYTITYTGHDRDVTELSASLSYTAASSQHYLDLAFRREKLENRAETFRELTNQNGATYYEYFDPVETGDKWWRDLQLSYTLLLGMQGETPAWRLSVGYQWGKRTQRAFLYPFFRRQHLHTNGASLSLTRNLLTRGGLWSFNVEGGFSKGSGSPYDDYVFSMPSARQEPPATMEAYLWREYQWLCAAQYHVGGSVQYAFVFPATRLKTFARLSASHRKANQTYDFSRGNDRTRLSLALGCVF